jgi:hypothetical protein
MGFREIGRFFVGTGYLSDFLLHRAIKRIFVGQGCLTKLAPGKETRLSKLQTTSRKNRETLFSIYKRCMDQTWTDFFEINANSLIEGSRHVWQPSFFRDVLVSDCADSFALVFNRPFFSDAAVELYSPSDSVIPFMLEDLLQILAKRGISYMQITLFHPIDNATTSWFKEKGLNTSQYVVVGKSL